MPTTDAVVAAALDIIDQSKACVRGNWRLLSETSYRISASRRRLNQAFAFTGASDDGPDPLRANVRARLASGALFPVGPRVIAGKGSGNDCVVCRNRVDHYEIEYEISLGEGVAVIAHLRCYVVWREESITQNQRQTA